MLNDKTHFILKNMAKMNDLKMGDFLYQVLVNHITEEKENYIKMATKQINDLIRAITEFEK
jgi:hypothetical protein